MSISKRNKRGLFIVLIFFLLVAYTPRILNSLNSSPDFKFTQEELLKADKELTVLSKKESTSKFKKKQKKKYKRLSRMTDPNTLSQHDWIDLGVTEKQAESILRFSKRGLRSNEDVKKIYVLPDELFILIKDSLFYPVFKSELKNNDSGVKKISSEPFSIVELNGASLEELESIPGIGPFYAKNILQKKEEFGGFSNKQQLLEIWKFDQEKLDEIQEFVFINSSRITKLNINLATIDELKTHPYISYKVANSIVKMRDMRGGYQSIDEIQESKLINAELFIKLSPYIELE